MSLTVLVYWLKCLKSNSYPSINSIKTLENKYWLQIKLNGIVTKGLVLHFKVIHPTDSQLYVQTADFDKLSSHQRYLLFFFFIGLSFSTFFFLRLFFLPSFWSMSKLDKLFLNELSWYIDTKLLTKLRWYAVCL